MTNPLYDAYQVLFLVYSDNTFLKQAIEKTSIEPLNKAKTVKICYGVLENDIYFNYCIKKVAEKSPKLPIRLILKISLYMIIFMDKQKYMVTDFAVELCKKLGKSGASGFINAFLRHFDVDKIDLPKNNYEFLSVKYSYPLFAVKELDKTYKKMTEHIIKAKTCGVSVRFENFAENYLQNGGYIKTPFENLFMFKNFVRDDGFDLGEYTFQSIGSVAICDVVKPCERLLDACSAPGGKSVLLSKKCDYVTAFELYEHRCGLIKAYAKRMKRDNIEIVCKDSSVFDQEYFEKFDGVLCDVPCSGFGTICENPDIKLHFNPQTFEELNEKQFNILNTCSRYVKSGKNIYFSTCSIFNRENDDVIERFLKENSNFKIIEIESPLEHLKTKYGLQFLPNISYGAGFYVCALQKD